MAERGDALAFITRRWPQLTDRAAIGQGARTAVVAFGGFALGYWGVHRVQVAVFATFSGLALTGIANFGGPVKERAAANAAATAAGVVLAAAGTWAGDQSLPVTALVTAAIGCLVVVAGLFGGYFAVGGNAVLLFYLVAVGSAAPVGTIAQRATGVALGGALAVLASLLLWPPAADEPLRTALAQQMRLLGDAMVGGDAGALGGAPIAVRRAIDRLPERPAGPTGRQRAGLYLLNDLERLEGLARRAIAAPPGSEERLAGAGAGRRLRRAADIVEGPTPAPGPDAASPSAFSVAWRIDAVLDAIERHARELRSPTPSARAAARHGVRRVAANVSWRSVHVQDALRTAAALGLACALARGFALQHGFWVELATLTVIRSTARATGRSAGQAVLGTAMGVALGFAVISAAGSDPAVYAVLTPLTIAAAIYARAAFDFVAGQAGFTVAVLVLFNLLAPSGWRLGLVRFEDVAVGAIVGLVASVVAWPRGPAAAMGSVAADMLQRSAAYLTTVLRTSDRDASASQAVIAEARRTALAAVLRAESAFAHLLAERPEARDERRWAAVMAAGNRLWYAADLLVAHPPPAFVDTAEIDAAAARLDRAASRAAGRVRNGTPDGSLPAVGVPSSALVAWIDDLAGALGTV